MNIMRRRAARRGAVRQPTGGRRRMGRGPVRSRPRRSSQAPQGVSTGIRRTASTRRPAQRLTAQQRARLAAQRRAKRPTLAAAKQTSGISATGKKAPRPSVDLRRGVSRITSGRRPKRRV